MYKLQISPIAREDLRRTKDYLCEEFGNELANNTIRDIIERLRKFQEYPLIGRPLTNMILIPTDYMYYVLEKNYVFYRLEERSVNVIRILNTRQDFMKVLFGDVQ